MLIFIPLMVSLALAQNPVDSPASAEWGTVRAFVNDQLQKRELLSWAKQLAAEPMPIEPAWLLVRFDLFVRIGYDQPLMQTIDAIAASKDPTLARPDSLIDHLIGRKQWNIAQRFVERRPTARPGWGYVLVNHMAQSMTPDEIDIFLANQSAIGDGPFTSHHHSPFAYDDYWLMLRVDQRNKLGTAGVLADQLADQVRKNPTDVLTVVRYYKVVTHLRTDKTDIARRDIAWLGETCKPALAFDSYHLGNLLLSTHPKLAVIFLERSLSQPWTDTDHRKMQEQMRTWARIGPTDDGETFVRAWTKRNLIAAYKDAGQPDKAQKLLEQVAAEEKTSIPVPGIAHMAGQVQADSGARVIEGRIREAEAQNKDSYEYWQTRGQYFAGRKETGPMIEAYEKALELAKKLGARPETHGHGARDYWPASGVLHNYAWALKRLNDQPAAEKLARRELQSADLATDYARSIVDLLGELDSESHPLLLADDEQLWRYLDARIKWEFTEEHLLQRMATNSRGLPDKREAMWKRGEQISKAVDPTRSKTLGWVMTRYDAQRRAIPLLNDAIARLSNDDQGNDARRSVQFNLFETYLELGDWELAEQCWPHARKQLTFDEQIQWLGDLAVQAAVAGATSDSMRLWQQRCAMDLASDSNLDDMTDAGMRPQLLIYYLKLVAENPDITGLNRIVNVLRTAR